MSLNTNWDEGLIITYEIVCLYFLNIIDMRREVTINNNVTDLYFGKVLSNRQLKILEILTLKQFELPKHLRMSAENLVIKAKGL